MEQHELPSEAAGKRTWHEDNLQRTAQILLFVYVQSTKRHEETRYKAEYFLLVIYKPIGMCGILIVGGKNGQNASNNPICWSFSGGSFAIS